MQDAQAASGEGRDAEMAAYERDPHDHDVLAVETDHRRVRIGEFGSDEEYIEADQSAMVKRWRWE
ncbi:hypothetical protein NDI85_21340 [Halomicroarcula sp. S1AR25-4]|uniref:hypothetical protein n=1 Tax=Haloarcula sp. S1AR25-4 TaxID=2950538 RepID=UPI0028769715|nr:hypothetical protein [Halomicroarcula sp. S1AR25-4]MDS0280333.1 hypothetical protein [Halomicroarcula sp. S1AR25-4]